MENTINPPAYMGGKVFNRNASGRPGFSGYKSKYIGEE
jgi:hypothetical protein